MTLKAGGSENDSACARMSWCATAWNVPPQTRSAGLVPRGVTRASMSSAARRVNVSSRIRGAATPCARSQAARATSVRVLPVPAPASTRSGPDWWVAARRWFSLRPSRTSAGSNM